MQCIISLNNDIISFYNSQNSNKMIAKKDDDCNSIISIYERSMNTLRKIPKLENFVLIVK